MNNENLSFLKKKFKLIEIENINKIKYLDSKVKDKISIIYCDPSNYYSSTLLNNFKNLKILASSTTSKGFIDEVYCSRKNIRIICLENEKKFLKTLLLIYNQDLPKVHLIKLVLNLLLKSVLGHIFVVDHLIIQVVFYITYSQVA